MRLDVTVEETLRELPGTRGWFRAAKTRPVWDVVVKLHLTEEERVIVAKRNLWEREFHLCDFPPEHFEEMTPKERELIGHVTDYSADLTFLTDGIQGRTRIVPVTVSCYTPQAAKQFEQHLVNKVMPKIKALINDSAEPNVGSRSYEI